VCEQFNEHKECDNKKCHFYNDHFVSANDVIKVVRCKDCKWCKLCYPAKAIGEEAIEEYYCNMFRQYRESNDYCSYGKLKEREGK
jgi:hypothetical protein